MQNMTSPQRLFSTIGPSNLPTNVTPLPLKVGINIFGT